MNMSSCGDLFVLKYVLTALFYASIVYKIGFRDTHLTLFLPCIPV